MRPWTIAIFALHLLLSALAIAWVPAETRGLVGFGSLAPASAAAGTNAEPALEHSPTTFAAMEPAQADAPYDAPEALQGATLAVAFSVARNAPSPRVRDRWASLTPDGLLRPPRVLHRI